jgi:hypothetical protein
MTPRKPSDGLVNIEVLTERRGFNVMYSYTRSDGRLQDPSVLW